MACCGRSGSSVLEFGFQLDSLVYTHAVDDSQCLLNSHLRPPPPPTLPDKYSTYHLHSQQKQHLPTTLTDVYSTYHPITMALFVPSHLIIHLYYFYANWWKLTLPSGPTWVGFFPPPFLYHRCRHSQRPKRRVPSMSAFRQPTKPNWSATAVTLAVLWNVIVITLERKHSSSRIVTVDMQPAHKRPV